MPKLSDLQTKCLSTLAKAPHGHQCFMGGGKRVHILNACRALVSRGLAMEFSNVYFVATKLGRETYTQLQAQQDSASKAIEPGDSAGSQVESA